jgi:hypothetical protein
MCNKWPGNIGSMHKSQEWDLSKPFCSTYVIHCLVLVPLFTTLQINGSPTAFVQHILEVIVQGYNNSKKDPSSDGTPKAPGSDSALTLVFLMDLLNTAASRCLIKPIVVFREIQEICKWDVGLYHDFVSSFEV